MKLSQPFYDSMGGIMKLVGMSPKQAPLLNIVHASSVRRSFQQLTSPSHTANKSERTPCQSETSPQHTQTQVMAHQYYFLPWSPT